MMTEYSLQNIKLEIPTYVKRRDAKGKAYYNYEIMVTCPAPFKRWKVERRYCQFLDLYAFFSGTRKLKVDFPRPSLMQFSLSKSQLAKLRIKNLEKFLIELLRYPDLRVPEMDKLYTFLDVDLMVDEMDRDSDFGDVRKELFPDLDLPEDVCRDRPGSDKRDPPRDRNDTEDNIKLTSSFNSEFRPTDDLSTDVMSSPARILASVASFHQENETKEWRYNVSADGLKEALRNNDKKAVAELLKKSKSLAVQVDEAGNPMIYTAALYGVIELGIALIKAGADPQSVNRQGLSAMDIAFDPWREAIQRYIDHRDQERLMAESCKYIKVHTIVTKNERGSLGLNIVRTTDNMPLVLGFTSAIAPSDGGMEVAGRPDIRPNDVICGVNGVEITELNTAVSLIRSSGNSVELTLLRRALTPEGIT